MLTKLLKQDVAVFYVALTAVVCGCGKQAPPLETWPVSGTVVDQNGERPTSGAVRLMTAQDANLITVGPIQPDGSFIVHTQRRGFDYPGAVPGEYQLIVLTGKTLPDGSLSPVRFEAPQPVVVKTGENQLEVKIQR